MNTDVSINGQWGLYSIRPATARGRAWAKRHLSRGERTVLDGAIMCEGGRACRDIVAAMVRQGLRVEVNGVDMAGFRAEG